MEEGGDPFDGQSERDADHDLIERKANAEYRHQRCHSHSGDGSGDESECKRIPGVSGDKAGIGSCKHHAFNADVENARLLGDLLAETGEQQRYSRRDGAEDKRTQEGLGNKCTHGYAFVARRR